MKNNIFCGFVLVIVVGIVSGCTQNTKVWGDKLDEWCPNCASLGKEFTLKKNQTAQIMNTGLEVKITEFYNSPCPDGVQCVWSGVGIGFEYRLNGEIQNGIDLVQAFGYQIKVIKTDYETYATLTVEKINEVTKNQSAGNFCCGSFSETTGQTKYYLSADRNCGLTKDVACAGSCPSVVENKFCQ